MSDALEVFLRGLLAEVNANSVKIEEDNASMEMPPPNLLWMQSSSTSEMSLSFSSLQQNSSASLDSLTSSRSSRWDSIPNIGGEQHKEKRDAPSMPRRSLETEPKNALGDQSQPSQCTWFRNSKTAHEPTGREATDQSGKANYIQRAYYQANVLTFISPLNIRDTIVHYCSIFCFCKGHGSAGLFHLPHTSEV